MPNPRILSREEKLSLQSRSAAGETPSLDEIRDYIHTTRVSFLAAEASKAGKSPKSRLKKTPLDENQIDFF